MTMEKLMFPPVEDRIPEPPEAIEAAEAGVCSECGSRNIIRDGDVGEHVCGGCGMVINEIVSLGPEWRAFNIAEREQRSRTGLPLKESIYDKGLSSVIDRRDKDIHGRKLGHEQRATIHRLRKWNRRSKVNDRKDSNLSQAFTVIETVSERLHLPLYIIERAAQLYRRALDKELVRGRSIDDLASACVYAAIRLDPGVSRTLKQAIKASGRKEKAFRRSYRLVRRELKLRPKAPTIYEFFPKIFNRLEPPLHPYTERLAENFVGCLDNIIRSGKGPASMAATITYISSEITKEITEERRTQKEISKAARITDVTLRNRYKGIMKYLGWEKDELPYMAKLVKIVKTNVTNSLLSLEEVDEIYGNEYHNLHSNNPRPSTEKLEEYMKRLFRLSVVDEIPKGGKVFYKLSPRFI